VVRILCNGGREGIRTPDPLLADLIALESAVKAMVLKAATRKRDLDFVLTNALRVEKRQWAHFAGAKRRAAVGDKRPECSLANPDSER
jgi:hypothetical protein